MYYTCLSSVKFVVKDWKTFKVRNLKLWFRYMKFLLYLEIYNTFQKYISINWVNFC